MVLVCKLLAASAKIPFTKVVVHRNSSSMRIDYHLLPKAVFFSLSSSDLVTEWQDFWFKKWNILILRDRVFKFKDFSLTCFILFSFFFGTLFFRRHKKRILRQRLNRSLEGKKYGKVTPKMLPLWNPYL